MKRKIYCLLYSFSAAMMLSAQSGKIFIVDATNYKIASYDLDEIEYISFIDPVKDPEGIYQIVSPQQPMAKSCYLFSLMTSLPEMERALINSKTLSSLAASRNNSFVGAATVESALNALRIPDNQITRIAGYIANEWAEGNQWDRLVQNHLIPSGMYINCKAYTNKEILAEAFKQDAAVLNNIIDVYGLKSKSAHCTDDAATATSEAIASVIGRLQSVTGSSEPLFKVSLEGAWLILHANDRQSTANAFEPYSRNCNSSAWTTLAGCAWDRSYGAIMVPGAGPDDYHTSIHEGSKKRCDLAITKYKNRYAPYIVVSGGSVHPAGTNYNEAEEMKKYLMEKGIPESAILMEPQARHTPTNFRNTVRLLLRAGMLENKKCIVVCEKGVVDNFADGTLDARCISELGYKPVVFSERLDDTSIEFIPVKASLNIGIDDPLDP